MEKEVFERASSRTAPPRGNASSDLSPHQELEAGVLCPVALHLVPGGRSEKYADTQETKGILQHVKEGIDGGLRHRGPVRLGDPGGLRTSPPTSSRPRRRNGAWRLYGNKFFCSAGPTRITRWSRPSPGLGEVGLFVRPMWLPGNKEMEIRQRLHHRPPEVEAGHGRAHPPPRSPSMARWPYPWGRWTVAWPTWSHRAHPLRLVVGMA